MTVRTIDPEFLYVSPTPGNQIIRLSNRLRYPGIITRKQYLSDWAEIGRDGQLFLPLMEVMYADTSS